MDEQERDIKKNKRKTKLFLLALIVLLALATYLDFASALDLGEYYDTNDDDSTTDVYLGQSFRANLSYTMSSLGIKISNTTSSDAWGRVAIYLSNGTGNPTSLIGENTTWYVKGSVNSSYEWVNITIPTFLVEIGKNYTIVVNNSLSWRSDITSPTYTRGNFLNSNDGITWNPIPSRDFMFQTFGSYASSEVTTTLVSPTDNYVLSGGSFEASYNVSNTLNNYIYNVTLRIYSLEDSLLASSTSTINNYTNISTRNITATISNRGIFNYRFETDFNASDGTVQTSTSDFRTFANAIEISILDSENELVSDGIAYIDNILYNSNPLYYPVSLMTDYRNESITINATSIGGFYSSNYTTLSVNMTNSFLYNVTLQENNLRLDFTMNGVPYNVTGYITDNWNFSQTFINVSFLKPQVELHSGIISVRFINSNLGGIENITWEDKVQFYEYDNTEAQDINETIEIIENINSSSYFQTLDNTGNVIQNARIRMYSVQPSNTSGGTEIYAFNGQRITDNNGKTVFAFNSQMEIFLQITADGYETKIVPITASEVDTFTSDNPYKIRLKKSEFNGMMDLYLGGLYKQDGTYVYESLFDDVTKDYYLFIYDFEMRSIKYSTDYENLNRSVVLDSTTRGGTINLTSGQQFDNTQNASFNLYIYADDVLVYPIAITFSESVVLILADPDDWDLKNSRAWRIMMVILLIMVSMLLGVMIKTGNDDVGLHTFFMGSLILPFAVSGLGWMAFISGFYYIGRLTKSWISE